jgi:hypothetical protein
LIIYVEEEMMKMRTISFSLVISFFLAIFFFLVIFFCLAEIVFLSSFLPVSLDIDCGAAYGFCVSLGFSLCFAEDFSLCFAGDFSLCFAEEENANARVYFSYLLETGNENDRA